MASLAARILGRDRSAVEVYSAERAGVDDYVHMLNTWRYAGNTYGTGYSQTLVGGNERAADAGSMGAAAFASNGIVFACMLVRMLVFSGIRFTYQRLRNGAPADIWGDATLRLLETPWDGGTTQDLIARMVQDADLMGSAYIIKDTPLARIGGDETTTELLRLDPLNVQIVLDPVKRGSATVGYRKLGYAYSEYGGTSADDMAVFLPSEVAQFTPTPDPSAKFRGMSWLTPVIRQIDADNLMEIHRAKFFEQGATPNMVIKHPPEVTPEEAREFRDLLNASHGGVANAYKTLHLGGGADLTVVGRDMEQVSFAAVQGHGETRIAAAAGVPPVIVGLSEGLQAATYSNYGQARRRFADGTAHPLWQNLSGSLQKLLPIGTESRLWYDTRDVPFLREDEKDAAEIFSLKAGAIQTLVNTGWEPDAVIAAVNSGDVRMLTGTHTGLTSVQLQAPGAGDSGAEPANESSEAPGGTDG